MKLPDRQNSWFNQSMNLKGVGWGSSTCSYTAYANSDLNKEVDAWPGLLIWFGKYSWKWTRALYKDDCIRIRYELICSLHKKSKFNIKLRGEKWFLLCKAPIIWSVALVHIKLQHFVALSFDYSQIYCIMHARTCLLNLGMLGCLAQEIRRWECKTGQNIGDNIPAWEKYNSPLFLLSLFSFI